MHRTTVIALLFGLAVGLAAAAPIAARGQRQLRAAQKLLDKLRLVDGPGSGLDADTVQGMTPAELRPAFTPPTAAETLAALRTVDGAGSGLDADTVQGRAPDQLAGAVDSRVGAL